jgi:hypothetical protein
MHVIRTVPTFQGHPVPTRVTQPQGPFPPELFYQSEVINEYEEAFPEDGGNFALGATAQNNFKPLKWFRCYDCHARVREDELDLHQCEEE